MNTNKKTESVLDLYGYIFAFVLFAALFAALKPQLIMLDLKFLGGVTLVTLIVSKKYTLWLWTIAMLLMFFGNMTIAVILRNIAFGFYG